VVFGGAERVQTKADLERVTDVKATQDVGTDAEIYARHRDELVRFATAMVGSGEAPDVVSSVLVKTLANHGLSELHNPRSYLFQAVANESRSVLRGRARKHELRLSLDDRPYRDREIRPEVVSAVAELPVRQRAATFLVYWMGCSVAEAADLMGIGTGTVGRYLHLARKRLRKVLNED
jgi:RNA polymerase sigma factor (sigma-70 family)